MSYDLWQTAFAFSMASNAATGKQGNVTALRADIQTGLALIEAELLKAQAAVWAQGWGPFVWQAPGSVVADNAMAALHNALGDTHIVVVAATNAASTWDWINEDLAVQPDLQVPWPGVSGAAISRATNIGLTQLLALQNSNNQNIQAYLKSVAGTGKTLIITGHSLAGALTPALALSLFPTGVKNSGWGNIYVMPTAGASPGNGTFVNAFATAFPPPGSNTGSGYQNWNVDIVNTLDVVPHAWMVNNLKAIPGLYTGLATAVQTQLTELVSGMVAVSGYPELSGAAYQSVQWATFSGSQQNNPIPSFDVLLEEILYQHVKAYMAEFGVANLFPTGANLVSGVLKALGA